MRRGFNTHVKTRQYACQLPDNHTATRIAKANFSKKSVYSRPKQNVTRATKAQGIGIKTKADANNSSNAAKTVKTTDEHQPMQERTVPSGKNNSIFVSSPRNYTEIAADVVRADCMNHGYRIERTVGEGAYAKVKLAEVLPSKLARNPIMAEIAQENDGTLQVAIKVIENKHVPKEFLRKFLPRELANHCPLPAHINVVRVFEQFRTTERIYVVMEYCSKGDMLDLINQRISESCKGLGEDNSRRLFRMMTEGLHHIHHNGIVHRDLKCENILLDKHDTLKITDFGFSTHFEPGKSALLKTSCGSYAYTAPEVIKMKAYDGTKSDTWSLGVILFAMLNGRLPFNDAQLNELEEDMKMQRLKFERHVSFDAMVLVRRILQYSPSSRPSTEEILFDPWLTGKRMIPRQQNKPKWVNPYQARKEEGDVKGPEVVGTNPVYYKSTVPERGPEATITVNHEKNETVVLKSRTGNKKNIWISGPPINNRPNTWPRSEKDKVNGSAKSKRGSVGSRCSSVRCKNTNTTVIIPSATTKPQRLQNKCPSAKCDGKARVSSKTIQMSKLFMEKYMNGKELPVRPEVSTDCQCCKLETVNYPQSVRNNENYDPSDLEKELCFDDLETIPDFEDVRFPSPVKNEADRKLDTTSRPNSNMSKSYPVQEQKDEPPIPARTEYGTCKSAGASSDSVRGKPAVTRKPTAKSARVRTATVRKIPVTSKTPEPNKHSFVNHMVSRSTSPAERVKYFRDRLMKMYGNDRVKPYGGHGLPPLMVMSLKPPSPEPSSPEPPSQKPTPSTRKSGSNTWRANRGNSGTTRPMQRVVVHSAIP